MNKTGKEISPLAEAEMETLEEGREWMRKRLERKLQRLVDRQGAVSPPEPTETQGGEVPSDSDQHNGR